MADRNIEVEVDLDLNENVQVKQNMNVIKTRAETYQRMASDLNTSSNSNIKTRKMNFIKCIEHFEESTKDSWSIVNTNCMHMFTFLCPMIKEVVGQIFINKKTYIYLPNRIFTHFHIIFFYILYSCF